MRPRCRSFLFATLVLGVPGRLLAQGPACVAAPASAASRTPRALIAKVVKPGQAAPAVDGRLDDAVWNGAEVTTDFFQYEPLPLACASERTEVRVVIDVDPVAMM